jgi:hypothetical protein
MKGKSKKTEQGWMVEYDNSQLLSTELTTTELPLHPTDAIQLMVISEQPPLNGMGGLVDFEIVTISNESISIKVAKLVDKQITEEEIIKSLKQSKKD